MTDYENAVFFVVVFVVTFLALKHKSVWILWLQSLFDRDLYSFAKPLLVALPSALIGCYRIDSIRQRSPDFFAWIEMHLPGIALGYIAVPVLVGLEEWVKKQSPKYGNNISSKGVALLLRALDSPVDTKMNRFLSMLALVGDNQISKTDVFQTITDPDKQLAEIIRAIHLFFDGYSKLADAKAEIEFTTVLFKMSNSVPVKPWCYFPECNRPGEGLLNNRGSLAANAAKANNGSGKTIIVENIEKEKRKTKSLISKNCASEHGSALCFPIKSNHVSAKVPLVLRITTNRPFFLEHKKVQYEEVLKRFEKRILIEYALSELKSYVTESSR